MEVAQKWQLDLNNRARSGSLQNFVITADDNDVSPRTLLVCEEFSNTLAMCEETCNKIRDNVVKAPAQSMVGFLKAYVGFSSSDCAYLLSGTQAGRRFLGLAAAVVSTVGPSEGGVALSVMIGRSKATNELHEPKIRQLTAILASLEPRCQRIGFADEVVRWYTTLRECPTASEMQRGFWKLSYCHPTPEGIIDLVNTFREIYLIGGADVSAATIKATTCAPWVIAFTEWCLGFTPTILLDDDTPVHVQKGAQVTVIASTDVGDCPGLSISVSYSVRGPEKFVSNAGKPWQGLITVESYGKWILEHFELSRDSALSAVQAAVPYAVQSVLTSLTFSEYKMPPIYPTNSKRDLPGIEERFKQLCLSPFGNDTVIAKLISRLIRCSVTRLPPLIAGVPVPGLPSLVVYLDGLKRQCACGACSSGGSQHIYQQCAIEKFLEAVAHITADILALSLFDESESVLISLGSVPQEQHPFKATLYSIFSNGNAATSSVTDLLHWALTLVGHSREVKEDIQKSIWIMSSYKGQVVYPKLLETFTVRKRGYLTLTLIPGVLEYKGSKYERVVEPIHKYVGPDPLTNSCEEAVTRPRNLVPNLRLGWRVSIGDDFLELSMGLDGSSEAHIHARLSPFCALINLSSALLLEACPHSSGSALNSPDPFCSYTGPLQPATFMVSATDDPNPCAYIPVGVVAVDGTMACVCLR
jgi:hypothetical protein